MNILAGLRPPRWWQPRAWTTWLTTEGQQVKRWACMPEGRKGQEPGLFPAGFGQNNPVRPVKPLPL
jgi:hypothetical protein